MGRLTRSLVVINLALGGCQFPMYAVHNISYEIDRCVDDSTNERNISKSAAQAWQEVECANSASEPYSEDFHAGFLEGFSYFVLRGGDGEPPPVAPQCYWKESFRTPEGHLRMQDWFSGYRHGSQTARAGLYRERELLSLSRPLQKDPAEAYQTHEATTDPVRK